MCNTAQGEWYAVRCILLFHVSPPDEGSTYEERITIWRATSAEDAINKAEREVLDYVSVLDNPGARYLGVAQSYQLPEEPKEGGEVYSLLRDSRLPPAAYVDRFFDTGLERQAQLDDTVVTE